MSGFAVLLGTGRPPAEALVRAMADEIASRGTDRRATRSAGACTMSHAALWTTPEADGEDQPQRHPTRDFWLTADARIDNRSELAAALRGDDQHLRTDSDLILAAY